MNEYKCYDIDLGEKLAMEFKKCDKFSVERKKEGEGGWLFDAYSAYNLNELELTAFFNKLLSYKSLDWINGELDKHPIKYEDKTFIISLKKAKYVTVNEEKRIEEIIGNGDNLVELTNKIEIQDENKKKPLLIRHLVRHEDGKKEIVPVDHEKYSMFLDYFFKVREFNGYQKNNNGTLYIKDHSGKFKALIMPLRAA
jgi:hypothetical protein